MIRLAQRPITFRYNGPPSRSIDEYGAIVNRIHDIWIVPGVRCDLCGEDEVLYGYLADGCIQ